MDDHSYTALTQGISKRTAVLRADQSEVMKGFSAMANAALAAGALDAKTKELIALAVSVSGRCDPCIGFHTRTLVKLGMTKAELEEMLSVVIYMGGGPALMYAAKTLAAFEEFSASA